MSYDASTELMSKKKGKNEIFLTAGSYNAGNQPEYGKDWEYYDVEHIVWSKGGDGETINRKSFDNESAALKYYDNQLSSVLKILKPSDKVSASELKKAHDLGLKAYYLDIEYPTEDNDLQKITKTKTKLQATWELNSSWHRGYDEAKAKVSKPKVSSKSKISQKPRTYDIIDKNGIVGQISALTINEAKRKSSFTFGKNFKIKTHISSSTPTKKPSTPSDSVKFTVYIDGKKFRTISRKLASKNTIMWKGKNYVLKPNFLKSSKIKYAIYVK